MKKGREFGPSHGWDKGKSVAKEEGKRASYRTRIGMEFDPKTSKPHDQEAVDKYLASYSYR